MGVNPFKFGFIGGTDVHTSLTSIEEDNFYGKHPIQEPRPNRWERVSKQGFGKTRLHLALHRRRLRGRVGEGEYPRGAVGRHASQGVLRHLRHTSDRPLRWRLELLRD